MLFTSEHASSWLKHNVPIKNKAPKMQVLESYHTSEVEGWRRTERKDVKSMGIFCNHRIVRLIAIISWLNEIRHDSADNALVAEENDTITSPVL